MLELVISAIERGLRYEDGRIIGISGKVLKPRAIGKGYTGIQIPDNTGGYINVYCHKLIYYLVYGDERAFDPQYEIHHKNHIRDDNNPSNLELLEARTHESISSKLNTHSAKITLEIAREIRNVYEMGGVSQTYLAKRYGLSQQHISEIIQGKKWGSIWD